MNAWVTALILTGLLAGAHAQGPESQPVPPRAGVATQTLPRLERFDIALVDAPAAQVFLQLAQGSPYQLLVAPDVAGRISLNLRQTTVLEALEAIKELYGYDYKIAGDKVYVYTNAVQTRIFRINYLPGRRQGESDTRVSTRVKNSSKMAFWTAIFIARMRLSQRWIGGRSSRSTPS